MRFPISFLAVIAAATRGSAVAGAGAVAFGLTVHNVGFIR